MGGWFSGGKDFTERVLCRLFFGHKYLNAIICSNNGHIFQNVDLAVGMVLFFVYFLNFGAVFFFCSSFCGILGIVLSLTEWVEGKRAK